VIMTNWRSPPPATPCRARPTISIVISNALAHMIELPKNNATATRWIGLRPQMSDRLAQIFAAPAFASKYAPPIHTYPAPECNSAEIVGIAVATIVWSRAATKRLS